MVLIHQVKQEATRQAAHSNTRRHLANSNLSQDQAVHSNTKLHLDNSKLSKDQAAFLYNQALIHQVAFLYNQAGILGRNRYHLEITRRGRYYLETTHQAQS